MQFILMDVGRPVVEDYIVTRRVLPLRIRISMATASVAVALLICEVFAGALRSNAFPYLNLFQRQERYGVVLEPRSTARVQSRSGRITDIRINSLGFRGPEWMVANQGRTRVLLLGDSQMFGYGVAEEQSLAGQLELLGFEALNASVPSWGPIEYAHAVEDLAPWFRPDVVLFVANVANDWPEANVENSRRSDARDGWLTRKGEPAGSKFPGRKWLLGRSQLVFAVREAWNGIGGLSIAAARAGRPPPDAPKLVLAQIEELARPAGEFRSRVTPHLIRAQKAAGVPVIALGLPMDVQAHPDEWAKYSGEPFDLSRVEILLDDFLADAAAREIAVIDLRPVLKASSPGAFLDDDYHLSPRGHHAIARAVAPVINFSVRTIAQRGSR